MIGRLVAMAHMHALKGEELMAHAPPDIVSSTVQVSEDKDQAYAS